MIPYFEPVAFQFGPIPIHLFGILVATGILLGVRQVVKRGEQLGLAAEDTASMTTWAIITGFLVSHVFDVLTYQPGTLLEGPWWKALLHLVNPADGISSFGGFLGALIGILVWVARRRAHASDGASKPSLLANLDAAAYGGVTGWFFGRLGCFSAHDHPGLPTHFFLGVDYGPHFPGGVRHDLGLYEAIFTLGLMIAFRLLARRAHPAGFYLALVGVSYAPVRFGLDFLRVADERYFGLTPAQYGSIGLFVVGVAMMAWLQRARSPFAETPAPSLPSPTP